MNIADKLLAAGQSSAPAILFKKQVLTYSQLRDRVIIVASRLLAHGFQKGDRIGIFAENSPFFVIAYLAIIRAGLVAVPFPTEVTFSNFSRIVLDAGLKTILVSERFANRLRPWSDELHLDVVLEAAASQWSADGQIPMPGIDPLQDLAALMFTSGSTGEPKGVMVTHRNIECNTEDIVSYMNVSTEDRVMVVLPFHYCFGTSLLHTHLLAGASLVLNNSFRLYPETVLQEMLATGCTGLAGVPSTFQILLRKSRFREMSFPGLRWLQQAGGKLANPYIAELQDAFPKVRFFSMYGQTEATARLSYLPPEKLSEKLGSIGTGLPSTKLEVLKPDGRKVMPGSGETGEIVASGDNVSPGYWKDPVETAKYFKAGRLHTGDVARVDSEGYIFIVEREREIIKTGGNRVSAKEVEEVIAALPEVIEVAVIGVPHPMLGEAIKAYVVVAGETISPERVGRHCRERLSAFKVPEEISFVPGLPHNSAGKVLKPKLKENVKLVDTVLHQQLQ